jgi:hypothetical protein
VAGRRVRTASWSRRLFASTARLQVRTFSCDITKHGDRQVTNSQGVAAHSSSVDPTVIALDDLAAENSRSRGQGKDQQQRDQGAGRERALVDRNPWQIQLAEKVVLGAENRTGNREEHGYHHCQRPNPEALATAIETRHPPGHIAPGKVGDRQAHQDQHSAGDAQCLRADLRIRLGDLGQADGCACRAQQRGEKCGDPDRNQPAEERGPEVKAGLLAPLALPVDHRSTRPTLVPVRRLSPWLILKSAGSPSLHVRLLLVDRGYSFGFFTREAVLKTATARSSGAPVVEEHLDRGQ